MGLLLHHTETSQQFRFNECGLQLATMKRLKSQQGLHISCETHVKTPKKRRSVSGLDAGKSKAEVKVKFVCLLASVKQMSQN